MGTSTEKGVHDFKDVFEKKNADILPKHSPYDCAIELQDGAQPPFKVVTLDVFREITSERHRPDERPSRPSAGGRHW
jgi:hypothetical protein